MTPPGEKPQSEPGLWILSGTVLRRVRVTPGVSDGELTSIEPNAVRERDMVVFELTASGRKAYGINH